jgi:hypothetical protein
VDSGDHYGDNVFVLEVTVLLVLAIVLLLVFGGLGFVAHILWLGLIIAVIIGIVHALTRHA